ncbi:MAG TPA: 3-dehydroquinate synthase [Polyangiaceae bacterium]|nr:3-dehydroquinate synthase [Polyangiaceae bacterium]
MRRPLLLNGFMATGKSTVARLVAERAGHPWLDLDAEIERSAGVSIATLFRDRGEAAFRALERERLLSILAQARGQVPPPVVALGGGALLRGDVRLQALDETVVVTLEASAPQLLARSAGAERPLLSGPNPLERIEELLEARRPIYAEAHARISTDGLDAASVAERVISVWQRDAIAVAAEQRSYAVEIARTGLCERLGELVRGAPLAVLVSDSNVFPLHGAPVVAALGRSSARVETIVLPAGEEHKTLAAPTSIWNRALEVEADRKTVFVALGGGVASDITGFAAAAWMRGAAWIGMPTTLLAMVDASVGGKTGVDLGTAKNAVGAFWPPSAVLCDVGLSSTEPARGFTSGLSEVVKTALIGDVELFELLEREAAAVRRREPELVAEMVRRCVRVKARIVGLDERESGVRATLNLGHTLGHALEAQGNYSALTHGEAVSLGLVAALGIGERLGLTPAALRERSLALLQALGLPSDLSNQPLGAASRLIGQDKKRAGSRLKFVVVRAVGHVETVDLPLDDLRQLARALV